MHQWRTRFHLVFFSFSSSLLFIWWLNDTFLIDPRRITCVKNTWNYTPTASSPTLMMAIMELSPSHLTGQFFDQPPQPDCTGASVVRGVPMCALAMDKESLKTTLRERRRRIGIAAINFEIYLSIVRSRVSSAFFSSSTPSHPHTMIANGCGMCAGTKTKCSKGHALTSIEWCLRGVAGRRPLAARGKIRALIGQRVNNAQRSIRQTAWSS